MNYKTIIAIALLVAVVLAFVLNARRARAGLEDYLADEGFQKQAACPVALAARGKDLREPKCWRGALTPSITADLVTGYIPAAERRGYRYFMGVIIPASAHLDDAWLRQWSEQDAYRAPDGSTVVLWNLVDERKNAVIVLDAIRKALPAS